MKTEQLPKHETNNQLPNIPKSREIYSGDINDAVITVQQITGYEITPDWWLRHVGNDGTTEEILDRFDDAFENFVYQKILQETNINPYNALEETEANLGLDLQEQSIILDEANNEFDKFNEQFAQNPEYSQLSTEFVDALRNHLIAKYYPQDIETKTDSILSINIEISKDYSDSEKHQLIESTNQALIMIDEFMGGHAAKVFKGLSINIGEGLAPGGGEALSAENKVNLNGRAMLMSLAEMRTKVPDYSESELRGSTIEENEPGGALKYTLVHEMGHILDELTKEGNVRHRIPASESPTRYGREPDEWNSEKDHEAFAEGFAGAVWGMRISEALRKVIHETIMLKMAQEN